MRRWSQVVTTVIAAPAAAGMLLAFAGGSAAARPAASPGHSTWRTAVEIPGLAALNTFGDAGVGAVSCAPKGYCAAGGSYSTDVQRAEPFLASAVNGNWGQVTEVPGMAALNTVGDAGVATISCPSAGNCAAGGFYNSPDHPQAFIVNQVHGTWRHAREVPGTAVLNAGRSALVVSLSCARTGYCTAVGSYTDAAGHRQGFAASETHGTWHRARPLPGLATLDAGGSAAPLSVSCRSAGTCSAGGYYTDAAGHAQAFVASQINGRWQPARQIPSLAALNGGGQARVVSVSCATPGNCSAGGYYTDFSSHQQAFITDQVNGTWGSAQQVPGTTSLGEPAFITSVSCATAGNCAAGGPVSNGSAFVARKSGGTWGDAQPVPGLDALGDPPVPGYVTAVSCASAGYCAAIGDYSASEGTRVFVTDEIRGTWHDAMQITGTPPLFTNEDSGVSALSCASAGNCAAGGNSETDQSGYQPFVVSRH
jgi:hypothetical protein